jgi:prophage regulatory protein
MPEFQTRRGLLRLCEILAPHGPIPVGRSTWWAGVKSGIFPQPIKLGARITAWRAEEIQRLVESGVHRPFKSRDLAKAADRRPDDRPR